MIWHDGPVAVKTCPVLSFTSRVMSALWWFPRTHRLVLVPMVGARYELAHLPAPGGAGEQDAWLMAALEVVRNTKNAILREQAANTRRGSGQNQTPRARKNR